MVGSFFKSTYWVTMSMTLWQFSSLLLLTMIHLVQLVVFPFKCPSIRDFAASRVWAPYSKLCLSIANSYCRERPCDVKHGREILERHRCLKGPPFLPSSPLSSIIFQPWHRRVTVIFKAPRFLKSPAFPVHLAIEAAHFPQVSWLQLGGCGRNCEATRNIRAFP